MPGLETKLTGLRLLVYTDKANRVLASETVCI